MIKKYYHYMILVVILLGFFGYKYSQTIGIEQITTDQLAEILNTAEQENIFYVDVREPHEFNEGHIKEMMNLPLSQLESNYQLIPKDKKVVIICRSGNRSLQAANILKDLGYSDLVNVQGGMLDWDGEVVK